MSETGTVAPLLLESDSPSEKMKEITDRLEKGVKEVFESDKYKEYLRVMSKFYSYSLNNLLLIAIQCPTATHVAGFSAWKNNFHRNVKKGEKGIRIIAPAPIKAEEKTKAIDPETGMPELDENGNQKENITIHLIPRYKIVSVFDVSQTEGKALPEYIFELSGDVYNYGVMIKALIKSSPVPVRFEDITNGANGYYSLADNKIGVKCGMSEVQTVKTLIHEMAHSILHNTDALKKSDNPPDRHKIEVQAESVAFSVCSRYGIDTSEYSFAYIAGWSKGQETKELKESLETIRTAAETIIDRIEAELDKMRAPSEKQKSKDDQEYER